MSTSLDKRREALKKIVPSAGLQDRMARLAEQTDDEIYQAALDDPDAQPSTAAQLRQGKMARRFRLDRTRTPG